MYDDYSEYLDIPVKFLPELSLRTTNALSAHGVTTLRQLLPMSDDELLKLRGLGVRGLEEIHKLADTPISAGNPSIRLAMQRFKSATPNYKLDEYLGQVLRPAALDALNKYYGFTSKSRKSISEIAIEKNVTRSRTHQQIDMARKKIKKNLELGRISSLFIEKLDSYARRRVKLQDITNTNLTYRDDGIARLAADMFPKKFHITGHVHLRSEWFVDNPDYIAQQVETAMKWLSCQAGFVPIGLLEQKAGVRPDILLDLKNVITKDGYIALVNGYRTDGIDRVKMIREIMLRKIGPVTVSELAKQLSLTETQVRSALARVPGAVNIGTSKYALTDFGYSSKNTEEIVYDYLKECGEPVHINNIIKHVLFNREVAPDSIKASIYIHSDTFARLEDGFVALSEWGYKNIATHSREKFSVSPDDAILEVVKTAARPLSHQDILETIIKKYKDKTTNASATIYAHTAELVKNHKLEQLGSGNIHYYRLPES